MIPILLTTLYAIGCIINALIVMVMYCDEYYHLHHKHFRMWITLAIAGSFITWVVLLLLMIAETYERKNK